MLIIAQNGILAEELARLQGVCEAQRELVKANAALNKHVVEMEEFEEKSKENRAKALSGEYTLLIYLCSVYCRIFLFSGRKFTICSHIPLIANLICTRS